MTLLAPRHVAHRAEGEPRRILSREECLALARRVIGLASGGGYTRVIVQSWWSGELRWARNRVDLASDRRETRLDVQRSVRGTGVSVQTNQLDDRSLENAVRAAERALRYQAPHPPLVPEDEERYPHVDLEYPKPSIWSDATYGLDAPSRGRVARDLIDPAERAGMLSAGYIETRAQSTALIDSLGGTLYAPCTAAQCSMTVRDPRGTGSGWAGLSSYDWARIDGPALARRALDKCLASRNPVALEPGRYTVILEPQAVCDLVSLLLGALSREMAEMGHGPFWLRDYFSKLGTKVVDERVTIGQDPTHPELGVLPFTSLGDPARPVTWIENGILKALATDRRYALHALNENLGFVGTGAFAMRGGTTTVEEMIRTTRRGLLVTRFSNVRVLDESSLLATGLTRDGLWLIENGKITKAVKNFRFTESPLFALNALEQLGPSVPVFRPGRLDWPLQPAVVPALKIRDFSFTSLADAI